MIEVLLPRPNIKSKPYSTALEQQGLAAGLDPVIARVIASRPLVPDLPLSQALFPKLKHLFSPAGMADMDRAAERVALAILNGECIGLETDHDCDGQSSHAVLFHNLTVHFQHPKDKIRSYIGHRLREGYGLSQSVADRILADTPRPRLLITADNGSSDEPRIRQLAAAGIDVVVTDHHEIPVEGVPASAYACLNPTRSDCGYGDPYVAGCMVAWLLMAATRQKLMAQKYLPSTAPSLMDSLDFVAVGTIADCVSMARSVNNRAIVAYGIKLIEQGARPCWRAVKTTTSGLICSEDLGFKIGPLLNSDGRLSTAFGSLSFLLSETDTEAMAWLSVLQASNTERKKIQKTIVLNSLAEAKRQRDQGRNSLCIYLQDSHSGVQGIAASRIKDIFGCPTVFFAPKVSAPGVITGSVRGIEKFHVREALQSVAMQHPELLIAFGGHGGAGGLTLQEKDFQKFSEAFEAASLLQLADRVLEPVIWTEGEVAVERLSLNFVDILQQLEPFGREFESPIFELRGYLRELRFIGDGTHARVELEVQNARLSGVWFGCRQSTESLVSVKVGDWLKVAFSVKAKVFREQRTLDLHIAHMQRVGG